MEHVIGVTLLVALGAVVLGAIARRYTAPEQNWIGACFGLHVISGIAQVWITQGVYGGGDMFGYQLNGVMLADWARYDPFEAIPELLLTAVRLPSDLPFAILGGVGSATSAMTAITGLAMFALGDSLYSACVLFALLNAFSQIAMYDTFRRVFPEEYRFRIAIATMLTPSVVFWTSAMLKESVAMIGMGALVVGAHQLLYQGRRVSGALWLVIGAAPFYVLKPYVLVGLVAAAAALVYSRRSVRTSGTGRIVIRPIQVALMLGVAVLAVAGFGRIFPEYSVDEFADEAVRLQMIGARISGGSNIQLVDPGTRSFAGQLFFAPLALATTLFRPFLFEVRGGPMLIGALETTVLTVLFLISLSRENRAHLKDMLTGSPFIVAGLAFAVTFGVAVGLASTNLGTLSRYRIPMMPFWVLFVALASARPRAAPADLAPVPRREPT
jgi:hypothetical protein